LFGPGSGWDAGGKPNHDGKQISGDGAGVHESGGWRARRLLTVDRMFVHCSTTPIRSQAGFGRE
jgi:hypothetical protein